MVDECRWGSMSGATVVEYALIAGLVGLAFLAGTTALRGGLTTSFEGQADRLAAGSADAGAPASGGEGAAEGDAGEGDGPGGSGGEGADETDTVDPGPAEGSEGGSDGSGDGADGSDGSNDDASDTDDEPDTGDGSADGDGSEVDRPTEPAYTADDLILDGATTVSGSRNRWDARLTVLLEAPAGTVVRYEWDYSSTQQNSASSGSGTCIVAGNQCLIETPPGETLRFRTPGGHIGSVEFRVTRVGDDDLQPPKVADPIVSP